MAKEKKDTDNFELEWWIRHRERAIQHKWYAIGRMDLLTISISAGGIYIVFQILKFIQEQKLTVDDYLLKFAGIVFTSAIILNFFSQIFGFYANRYEAKWSKLKINQTRKIKINKVELSSIDNKVTFYNKGVLISNGLSIFAMLSGIILLVAFNYLKF